MMPRYSFCSWAKGFALHSDGLLIGDFSCLFALAIRWIKQLYFDLIFVVAVLYCFFKLNNTTMLIVGLALALGGVQVRHTFSAFGSFLLFNVWSVSLLFG